MCDPKILRITEQPREGCSALGLKGTLSLSLQNLELWRGPRKPHLCQSTSQAPLLQQHSQLPSLPRSGLPARHQPVTLPIYEIRWRVLPSWVNWQQNVPGYSTNCRDSWGWGHTSRVPVYLCYLVLSLCHHTEGKFSCCLYASLPSLHPLWTLSSNTVKREKGTSMEMNDVGRSTQWEGRPPYSADYLPVYHGRFSVQHVMHHSATPAYAIFLLL